VRLTGLVDKKVPLDFDSIQQNDRKYFVFVIPDIAPGQTRKVNIVSFFSKKAGSRQILGEIRTIDGQKIIAKPATVIVN
jgi:mannitol/fructose-specific phosphotransferase system IIA component (Ntr-type)